ncbi:MAG: alkaline phosphatase D family protein, partial [Thermoleophilaceae bacterium]
LRGGGFASGVMAGVPGRHGATLWTRLDGVERGGLAQLEVARDRGFQRVVERRSVRVRAERDFTACERVRGLQPGERYFFRFEVASGHSPVGRFRTLRPPDSHEPVRIGWFTCQNYEEGYFNAHPALAREPDLDFVVCLGDYIYEYGGSGRLPGRRDPIGEATTLDAYRAKYNLYRSDPRLRELHSAHAIVPVWDDHEVKNNCWRAGSEGVVEPGFAERREAAYRAWFEHMPVPRFRGERTRIYRLLRAGALADVIFLDERQYRDAQPCGDAEVVPCPDAAAPRSFLGVRQLDWLRRRLERSQAAWKLIANADMIMGLDAIPGGQKFKDTWDGYAAERRELVEFIIAAGVGDVVFVTGDDHDNYAGVVTTTGKVGGLPGALEFVVPSMTSLNTGEILGGGAAAAVSESTHRALNPHLELVDQVNHGYVVTEARRDELLVDFRHTERVDAPEAAVFTAHRFRVPRGNTRLEPR